MLPKVIFDGRVVRFFVFNSLFYGLICYHHYVFGIKINLNMKLTPDAE